jgi:hypothetical protein
MYYPCRNPIHMYGARHIRVSIYKSTLVVRNYPRFYLLKSTRVVRIYPRFYLSKSHTNGAHTIRAILQKFTL